ncbi:IS3 family transposase [Domibacillus sp. A3M-37]|uniref:IS3 family transposase n=1 Tax=Domibacillus sp. A3M-37 TaxID=2962037 RepID=UPI0035C1A3BC
MRVSMSRKGNCLDNPCIESFFDHLKSECSHLLTFNQASEVKQAIDEYTQFYNAARYQKKPKNLSPVQFRRKAM